MLARVAKTLVFCLLVLAVTSNGSTAWEAACGISYEPIMPGSASYPGEIEELTQRLAQLGYNPGQPAGLYDAQLEAAVRRFQADKGLTPHGVLDDSTWMALAGPEANWLPVSTPTAPPQGEISLLVDANKLRLTVFVDGKEYKSYPIAVGRPSLLSPVGEWKIVSKGVNWGGGFGTRWLGLNVPWGIYGIHGTNKPYSIGTRASHGCIRMFNQHVEELYRWVPVGTPVKLIGPAPTIGFNRSLKQGTSGKDVVYVQMHLQEMGFDAKGADGRFGSNTTKAVQELQQRYGLPTDGTVYDDVFYILGLK